MSSRLVLLGGALLWTTVAVAAQQPANPLPLGVIRVLEERRGLHTEVQRHRENLWSHT